LGKGFPFTFGGIGLN